MGRSCLASLELNYPWLLLKQHGYWLAAGQTKGGSYLKLEKLIFKLKKSRLCVFPLVFLHDA